MPNFLINLLMYLVAISILVAAHEFGHFWVARRVGVKVLRFSIGFGRVLWKRDLKDGTEFAISAIPIGGYVSMLGERDDNVPARDAHRAFRSVSPAKRIAVMAAGPIANFIFAILIYWVLFMTGSPGLKPIVGTIEPYSIAEASGLHTNDEVLTVNGKSTPTRQAVQVAMLRELIAGSAVNLHVAAKNDSTRDLQLVVAHKESETAEQDPLQALGFDFWRPAPPAILGTVDPSGPAASAGLRVGDEVVRVDGESVADFEALTRLIQVRKNQNAVFQIRRNASLVDVQVRIGEKTVSGGHSVGRVGFGSVPARTAMPPEMFLPRDSLLGALGRAVNETVDMTAFVFQTVGYLIVGKVSLHSVSGPVGIAAVAGEAARIGFVPFISLLALLSISIGALNLLPIPVLDGGQIVFQVAELLKGGPVSERAQALAQQVGITLLVLLTVLALFNDIARLS